MSASPKDGAAAAAHDLNARVQEALSERLSAGGLAVPPGGDS